MEPKINKKRVLFVITQEEFGGAQRFLYELTIRLDKDRYEILVASGSKEKSGFLRSLEQIWILKQYSYVSNPLQPENKQIYLKFQSQSMLMILLKMSFSKLKSLAVKVKIKSSKF